MKKWVLALVLALCMVLFAVAALAATTVTVTDEAELRDALKDAGQNSGTNYRIKLANGIDINTNDALTISANVTLDLNGKRIALDIEGSLTITNHGTITDGTGPWDLENTFPGVIDFISVVNEGVIEAGDFGWTFTNRGKITGGTFYGNDSVNEEEGEISGGTFQSLRLTNNGKITGGTFTGYGKFQDSMVNHGTISGGTFKEDMHLHNYGKITAGSGDEPMFECNRLVNKSTGVISGGTFTFNEYNYGTISGGSFLYDEMWGGELCNYGVISDGYFTQKVFNRDGGDEADVEGQAASGKITGGTFKGPIVNNGEKAEISGGEFFVDLSIRTDVVYLNYGVISGGKFGCEGNVFSNCGTISGGEFSLFWMLYSEPVGEGTGIITGGTFGCGVENKGTIENGTFNGGVSSWNTISGGTFSGDVYNDGGTISGGTFSGDVYNDGGMISDGEFRKYVLFYDGSAANGGYYPGEVEINGEITLGGNCCWVWFDDTPVWVLPGQPVSEKSAPTRSGYINNGWVLNGAAYDFDTRVMEDLHLTGEWTAIALPSTGDQSALAVWCALLLFSYCGVALLRRRARG